VPGSVGQAHLRQHRGDLAGLWPAAGQPQRQRHVLRRGQRRHQVERLEHEAHPLPAQLGQRAFAETAERHPVDDHLAAGGAVQAGRAVQQRGLAGAGRTHDGGERGVRDLQVDGVQRGDRAVTRTVDAAHRPELDGEGRGRDGHAYSQPAGPAPHSHATASVGGIPSTTVPGAARR
jgi:hypothetical protein